MRTETSPKVTRLSDYTPYPYAIDHVALDFDLDPQKTRVQTHIKVRRLNKTATELVLDGSDIALIRVMINGLDLKRSEYRLTQSQLILPLDCDEADIEIVTTCAPARNTQLMGLYVSGGRFCTQCEAEGFRRITFYPDRPDVMSVFRVRLAADKTQFPTLLANGNLVDQGDLPKGRHFAVWEDPFRKPCYLFALVAGQFEERQDSFTTMTGRKIDLSIFCDPGDLGRTEFAMDALKRSMAWDETAFGREYDLDRFMIVAVRDFNFGAMENKGLNVFNSALLLADPERATDLNFERIESVVAHEYFHNWSGNRVTCRDWFQLCLKEGFTVFRDQEFSADMRGAGLQRIKDVRALRARQFAEDAGPLSHPVRPSAYEKIDNFYTATIYEKGAELIRVLKTLLGPEIFRRGSDEYFDTLDGTASTIEEFVACFERVSGKDLSGFLRWYSQAGTPRLSARAKHNAKNKTLNLTFTQFTPDTPGQTKKRPVPIPISLALLSASGSVSEEQVFVLDSQKGHLEFSGISEAPTISLLRGFSAPVLLDFEQSADDLAHIMAFETDLFARWEAGQTLAQRLLQSLSLALAKGRMPPVDFSLRKFTSALGKILDDEGLDDGFKALCLSLPSVNDILTRHGPLDPLAVHAARNLIGRAIADHLQARLERLINVDFSGQTYSPDAGQAGRRALRSAALTILALQGRHIVIERAQALYEGASNMTDQLSSLATLIRADDTRGMKAADDFYARWKTDPLTVDKWFMLQASRMPEAPIGALQSLLKHPDYEPNNPNRVRSLIGGFAGLNTAAFHAADGSGYQFFTDQVLDMDARNPSVAARLLGVFEIWPKLDTARQDMIRSELQRVIDSGPSANVAEIARKALG